MPRSRILFTVVLGGGLLAAALLSVPTHAQTPGPKAQASTKKPPDLREFFDTYCIDCHNKDARIGGLTLDTLDVTKLSDNAQTWEKVIGKLRAAS